MNEVTTDVNKMGLDQIAKGKRRFSISCDDTPENATVHEWFKEFALIEADNNYTQALRLLKERSSADFKTELLADKIFQVEAALNDLKGSVITLQEAPKKTEDSHEDGAF